MARYFIDADILCESLNSMASVLPPFKPITILEVISTIENTPTADVVPKSEVEKFAEEIKLEFYREFDEIIPSIMADKIDELKKKYMESEDK